MKREHWTEDANCSGVEMEVFFPKSQDDDRFDLAKEYCQSCRVKRECLLLAINNEDHDDRWGVFGGLTPAERRQARHKKRKLGNG